MFQPIAGVIKEMARRKGTGVLALKCGHVKRARFTGSLKAFCAWCASGTRPVSGWIPQTPHVHPRHRRTS